MAEERRELFLIDGSGYIFRAFFALPPLTNSRGMPTGAVYGFARMLLKLLKEERPTFVAVVFDSAKKTFRDDLFEQYKANRPSPPSDLKAQIPYIHRLVEAFRITSIILDGYEADDVIGTIAARAARKKFATTIVTADKDFMQLVGPTVSLWDTMRDKRTGVREVRARFGVEPRAVVDIMALMGDPIDNVKGVPGVGEKTAVALIQKFGSLDNLDANLDRLGESGIRGGAKLAALLEQHRADVELARKLVRIETDVPISTEPESLEWPGIDTDAVVEILRELEFDSLLSELAPSAGGLPATPSEETRVERKDAAAVAQEMARAPRIALHFGEETGSANPRATGQDDNNEASGQTAKLDFAGPRPDHPPLKLKAEGGKRAYVIEDALIPEFKHLLEADKPPKACHDLKHHLRALQRCDIALAGADFDTMLAGFLVNPGRPEPSLENLYHQVLAPLGGKIAIGSEPELVLALRNALEPKLEEYGLAPLFRDIEIPVAAILAEMEATGIAVDAQALRAMSAEFGSQMQRLEQECFRLAGRKFNLNSPTQLRELLFSELKLPTKGLKRTKSGYSTDVDTLTKLAAVHELPKKILDYRAIAKLKTTYSDSLPMLIDPATGRIHTSFHQALTATGRLSSTEPNLQNIPARGEEGRRIRRAFVADRGFVLLSADYSQIELRILAHLSADPTLVEAFHGGEDIHVRTATEVLGIRPDQVDKEARRLAKVINFGIIYGMGPQRLAAELGIALNEASDYIRRYFDRLPGVRAYLDDSLRQARERGFITTMFGRRRYLPELNAPDGGARSQAERIAINTPIQGSAADLIKLAMVRVHSAIRDEKARSRMLLQVHDELLFEVKDSCVVESGQLIRAGMENVAELRVPLRVELKSGRNWAEISPF
jgi:DNA polymerase I